MVGVGEYVDVGGGGGGLQKCSFGRGSRMIRARSRMIRARPNDPGRGPDDPGRSISLGNCSGRTRKRREIRRFRGFWMDFEGKKVGKSKIHELHTESTDQNQQNIIKTKKSQNKILGLFLVGIFGFRTKTTKST